MYITVMDYSTCTVTKLVQDKPIKNVEDLLQRCGYHLSEIAYMISEEEPQFGLTEVSDILENV